MSAWLLDASPWTAQPERRQPVATSSSQINNKRTATDISNAETTLGKLAQELACRVKKFGWQATIAELHGESNITSTVGQLPHRAARLLKHLRLRGASVPMTTAPWSRARCDAAVARGSHQSSHSERAFVAEEMLDFCQQGYWVVLPYDVAVTLPGLRISPLGVVPQRDRRPRLIVDYTFSGVN